MKPLAPLALLLAAALAQAQTAPAPTSAAPTAQPATRPAFTLGHDTTRITSPLLPDGRPDYVAHMDQILSKGVTKENNAFVALLEVFGTGPDVIPEKIHDQALERLGITEDYPSEYQSFPNYLKKQGINYAKELQDQELLARKHRWDADEFPEIARWLAENDQALDQVIKAAGRDHYHTPMIATSDRTRMSSVALLGLGEMGAAANALTTRAMLRLDKGQIKEAQADLIAVHRLGRLVSQRSTLVEKLVSCAIETTAALADLELADGLKPDLAKSYLAELDKLPPMHGVAESVDLGERFLKLDAILSISKYGLGVVRGFGGGDASGESPFPPEWDTTQVDWDTVLRQMNGWFDRMVTGLSKPKFSERKAAMAALGKELATLKDNVAKYQAAGDVGTNRTERTERMADLLIAILMPSLARLPEMADRAQQHTDLATLALALAAYRGDKGAYPEKLQDLAPAYLKSIPNDLFADAPLKYTKEGPGYTLYSIGPDLQDDHGTPGKTDATGDLVVKMFK